MTNTRPPRLPVPLQGETEDRFVARAMSDPAMRRAYPDRKHRALECYSRWRARHAAATAARSRDVIARVAAENNCDLAQAEMHLRAEQRATLLRRRYASLEGLRPLSADEQTARALFVGAFGRGWTPPSTRPRALSSEILAQQQEHDRHLLAEFRAAGLDRVVEQVLRERSENERVVSHVKQMSPIDRAAEIRAIAKIAGMAARADEWIATGKDITDVRSLIAREKCRADEELGLIRTKRRADVSEGDNARLALDAAIEQCNAQVSP